MTQREVEYEVAAATGESLAEVRRMGFGVEQDLRQLEIGESRRPLCLDWDSGEARSWPFV